MHVPAGPPKNPEEYNNFIRKMVKRYKDKVKYWQIENEVYDNTYAPAYFWDGTKEEYIEHLRSAYATIKQTDPKAKVVCQGFGGQMLVDIDNIYPKAREFFEYIMREIKDCCDLIDFHQYLQPKDAYKMIEMLKDEMAKNSYRKEIICTEAGDIDLVLFSNYFMKPNQNIPIIEKLLSMPEVSKKIEDIRKFGVTHEEFKEVAAFLKQNKESRSLIEKYQAENLIKRMAITLSQGIKQVHWASIKDYALQKSPDWYHLIMSLTDSDGRKKPHFYTYKLLIEKMEDFIGAEEISRNPAVVRFNLKDKQIYVAWSDRGEEFFDFSGYIQSSNAKMTNIITEQGERNPQVQSIPANSIKLTSEPVLIEQSGTTEYFDTFSQAVEEQQYEISKLDDPKTKFGFQIFPLFQMFSFGSPNPNKCKKVFSALENLDTNWVRIGISWKTVEPRKGKYNFLIDDKKINLFYKNNFNILVFVAGAPDWAAEEAIEASALPPKNPQDFANFLRVIAERYKGKIAAWEIWNEPGNTPYWGNRQSSPKEYIELLKPAYKAIKETDPNAIVVGACTLIQFMGEPRYSYLKGLLENGLLDYSDVISVHIYPKLTKNAPREFDEVMQKVERVVNNHGKSEIWLTEVGITSKNILFYDEAEKTQADFIKHIYLRSKDHRMFWFQLSDGIYSCGILDKQFNPKTAYNSLRELIKRRD